MFRKQVKQPRIEEPGVPPSGPAGASSAKISEPNNDAFAAANFGPVVLIQLMRLYDIQLALLSIQDPIKAQQLVEMHEQGLTFAPAPSFAVEQNENDCHEETCNYQEPHIHGFACDKTCIVCEGV